MFTESSRHFKGCNLAAWGIPCITDGPTTMLTNCVAPSLEGGFATDRGAGPCPAGLSHKGGKRRRGGAKEAPPCRGLPVGDLRSVKGHSAQKSSGGGSHFVNPGNVASLLKRLSVHCGVENHSPKVTKETKGGLRVGGSETRPALLN